MGGRVTEREMFSAEESLRQQAGRDQQRCPGQEERGQR